MRCEMGKKWYRVFPTRVGVNRRPGGQGGGGLVFPTRVRVNRVLDVVKNRLASFPHARGGEPRELDEVKRERRFSPRAWG